MRIGVVTAMLAVLLVCQGCTWQFWYGDFVTPRAKFSPPAFERIEVGYSRDQVRTALGKPDATAVPAAGIEVWEYWQYEAVPGPDRVVDRYHVKFQQGKAIGWGRGL